MRILTGHRRMVNSVCFSPDGRRLLSTGGYSTDEARLFDLATGKALWAFYEHPHTRYCGSAFTPEGTHLLICDTSGSRRLLEIDSLAEVPFPLRDAASHPFGTPIFSPGGTRLLARGETSDGSPCIRWWAYPSWVPLPTWTISGLQHWAVRYCQPLFSPDSRTLAEATFGEVLLHEVATGEIRRTLPVETKDHKVSMAFDPTSQFLAFASGSRLVVWDIDDGAEVTALSQPKKHFLGVAFTRDGRHMGTVSNEETVKLWDTSGWRLDREYAWQVGGLKCLAFSPDGMLAAAGSDKNRVVLWDLDD
jgi:WD40 repeat protein